jgi:hypothetical protein
MDTSKIEPLVALLRARYETNQSALDRFNALYNGEDPPAYDTELAESDGMVQGQQQVIRFALDFLNGDAATFSPLNGLAHIQQAVAENQGRDNPPTRT